jgi:hypothetical protein
MVGKSFASLVVPPLHPPHAGQPFSSRFPILGARPKAEKCGRGKDKQDQKGGWRAGGMSASKPLEPALRTWKAGGKLMCSRSAGLPPATLQKIGKQEKKPMFSVISRPRCPSWEVRLPSRASKDGTWEGSGGRDSARSDWQVFGGTGARPKCLAPPKLLVPRCLPGCRSHSRTCRTSGALPDRPYPRMGCTPASLPRSPFSKSARRAHLIISRRPRTRMPLPVRRHQAQKRAARPVGKRAQIQLFRSLLLAHGISLSPW